MIKASAAVLLIAAALSACSPARIKPPPRPDATEAGTIVIARRGAFNQFGVTMVIGLADRDVAELYNDTYTEIQLPAGRHRFYVRGIQADVPSELEVEVEAAERVCIDARPRPENWAKSMLAISYFVTSSFYLEPVACRKNDSLKQLPFHYLGEEPPPDLTPQPERCASPNPAFCKEDVIR